MSPGRAAAGIAALEEYAMKDSPLGRIHPGVKLFAAAVYLVCTVSFPATAPGRLAPYLLYPAVLLPLADIPLKAAVIRLVPAMPFALMGGISCLLVMRDPAFAFGNLIVSRGVLAFAAIMLKTVLCVSAALILAGSTPFHVLCAGLRRLRVPSVLCLQLMLCYRYIAVLLEEAQAMYTACILRSTGKRAAIKDMGPLLGTLLLRGLDRADRVYNAMRCRGFRGTFFAERKTLKAADIVYCAVVCAAAVFFRFFNVPRFIGTVMGNLLW
ncbi:MAG: cobalt ECF transporter T component CbiQ [Treponema sp.]|jgi:cobalt/nickel transport system permease protein|nr:cobalt ECF transporter T component CbiQ [Treponema sp.]